MKAGTCWSVSSVCCVILCAAGVAQAQELNWAEKMLEHRNVDFGVVARGAETVKRVKVKNIYAIPVTVSNVVTSCSCAAVKASHAVLQPGEEGTFEISMDTVRHMREKTSGVLARFDMQGYNYVDIRIPLKVYIRTDVVLNPGSVNFNSVDLGVAAERKLRIEYAGRADWSIREVKTSNPHLEAKVVETNRTPNGDASRVVYDLVVNLKSTAPAGELREQLVLVTDDQANQVPVSVSASIESEYTITPEVLSFGTLSAGQTSTKTVVIRAKKPFMIEKIECEKDHGAFKVKLPQTASTVHVLPITVVPVSGMTSLEELFTVKVSGRTEPLVIRANVRVQPSTVSAN